MPTAATTSPIKSCWRRRTAAWFACTRAASRRFFFRAHRLHRAPRGGQPGLCSIGVGRTDGTRRSLRVGDDAKGGERPCRLLAKLRHARLLVRIVGCQRGQLIDNRPRRRVPLDRTARAFENPTRLEAAYGAVGVHHGREHRFERRQHLLRVQRPIDWRPVPAPPCDRRPTRRTPPRRRPRRPRANCVGRCHRSLIHRMSAL